jgi:neutral trehalase
MWMYACPQVVPADLNGLLYRLCCTIARLAGLLGQAQLEQQYERLASEQLAALHTLMWDPAWGCWRDLLLPEGASGEVAGGPYRGPLCNGPAC